jgi:hypothetical protein
LNREHAAHGVFSHAYAFQFLCVKAEKVREKSVEMQVRHALQHHSNEDSGSSTDQHFTRPSNLLPVRVGFHHNHAPDECDSTDHVTGESDTV